MGICEPSHALLTVSGFQTDALVSDYNSKDILTIPIEEPMMEKHMDEGKVRFIGVSNLSTYHCPARSRWLGHRERQLGSDVRGALTAW